MACACGKRDPLVATNDHGGGELIEIFRSKLDAEVRASEIQFEDEEDGEHPVVMEVNITEVK